jgi:hypothetical protein
MSQSDFASLAVQCEISKEILEPDTVVDHGFPICKLSADLQRSKSEDSTLDDASTDFITDAMSDFIAAWQADCADIEATSGPVSWSVFEPIRRVKNVAPPQRFNRTFGRFASRRVLLLTRAQT